LDANGTRYHLLLGEEDWLRCGADGLPLRAAPAHAPAEAVTMPVRAGLPRLAWDGERSDLTLRPRLFQFAAAPKDVAPELGMRRGAARDRYGNWYWIDRDATRLRVNSAGTRTASTFWPPDEGADTSASCRDVGDFRPRPAEEPPAPLRFSGLTVTEDHYLVVGVVRPAGLILFDLHAGGAPQQILWPEEIPFSPFDMVAAPGGGLFVLDRNNARYWALDRRFNVRQEGSQPPTHGGGDVDFFRPRVGGETRSSPTCFFGEGVSADASVALAASDPIAIEVAPDATVLVLDRNPGEAFCRVFLYRAGVQAGPPATTAGMASIIEEAEGGPQSPPHGGTFTLRGYDFAFVPGHDLPEGARVLDRIYIVGENGNQTFAFNLSERDGRAELQPLADYLPMRLFGGRALARAGAEVFYDYGENWVPLVEQRRPRYEPFGTLYTPLGETASAHGTPGLTSHAFDGREPDCVWHRLMLDACIPPETEVLVSSRAADDERELALAEWRPEPRLYLRGSGSELPFLSGRYGTWELLFQNARGRFLQLRIELSGNGRTTPRLRALRAYYPRFSYLERYLPAAYREDASSASFLERFLANFEGLYTTIEDRIAAAQMLFDVRSAPAEALDWLAGWFGAALDPTWDGRRKRLFIKHAMRLFQMRGTIRGLEAALRLSLEDCPDEADFDDGPATTRPGAGSIRIVEKFRTRRTPSVVLGDPTGGQGPRFVSQTARWSPAQGGEELRRRYAEYLQANGSKGSAASRFPLAPPHDPAEAPAWQRFTQETLGFVPAATGSELSLWHAFLTSRYGKIEDLEKAYGKKYGSFVEVPLPTDMPKAEVRRRDWREFISGAVSTPGATGRRLWQDYLARRHRSVGAFNAAYRTAWPSFALVALPGVLPNDGRPLLDWYQFESVVLPMRQSAHRFTVLLPLPPGAASDDAEQRRRLELAARIVRLEKPEHTVFDVKFYWQMFRLGEARLGEDTLIDLGSRAPGLMSPLVVGRGRLTESYLAPGHPRDVTDRRVLGRDPLGG